MSMNLHWNYDGASALTLYGIHTGHRRRPPTRPSDPSDFYRIVMMMNSMGFGEITKAEELIAKAAKEYPHLYGPMVGKYEKWLRLLEEESPNGYGGDAPKLYDEMKKAWPIK